MKILLSILPIGLSISTSALANNEPTTTPPAIRIQIVSEPFKVPSHKEGNPSFQKDEKINTAAICRPNQPFSTKASEEFIFPSQYSPAAPSKQKNVGPTPVTPKSFETKNSGLSVEVYPPEVVKGLAGETLVSVNGHADFLQFKGWAREHAYGEHTGAIVAKNGNVLSPNVAQAPIFETTTTYFQLFAKPGKSYDIKVKKDAQHWITLHLTCDLKK